MTARSSQLWRRPVVPLVERFDAALLADTGQGREQLRLLEQRAANDPNLHTAVRSPFLLRPTFLHAPEKESLERDIGALSRLMLSLPERLFGGDVGKMCDVLGFSPGQRAAIEATWSDADVILTRADILRDAVGFKVVEVNLHASLGGIDCGPWHRAFLELPFFADLVAAEQLTYVDPVDGVAGALRTAGRKRGLGSFPSVALVDWPTSYPHLAARLDRLAKLLRLRGLDAFSAHAGQLRHRAGHLYAGNRRVDILYRIFVIEDLPDNPALLGPILAAHRAGNLVLAMSFLAELVGNKGCLALLSDPAHDSDLDTAERALVQRIVPWTRFVKQGGVTWRTRKVDLETLCDEARNELVLKPVGGYAARGVVPGWTREPAAWRAAVAGAVGKPWVLQERVEPVPERMPRVSADGIDFIEFDANWGVFGVAGTYNGTMIRAIPSAHRDVISTSNGASVGCCFHQRS